MVSKKRRYAGAISRGELQSEAPIIYVDLDAETVSYMGDRPWDRREFGCFCMAF